MTPPALQQKLAQAFAFHKAGQLAKAEPLYKEILQAAPKHFDALHMLGVIHLQNGRNEEALRLIGKAVGIDPTAPVALNNHGNVLQSLGRHQDALTSYDRALTAKPDYDEALKNRGVSLLALARPAEALASFDRAVALRPLYAAAFSSRGDALRTLERYEEALASYARALALEPSLVDALVNYGGTLRTVQRYEDALATYDKVLALAPDHIKTLNNRGAVLRDTMRYAEALASFDKALALKPDYIEALVNRGTALHELGREDEALASFDKAQALNPDHPESHWNKALTLLMLGNFAKGWPEYEWRWKCAGFRFPPRGFTQPQWRGETLEHGDLLVWGEQGIGDEILYGGMVGDLMARGISVIWESDPRLAPLIRRSYSGVRTIARTTPPDPATSDPAIRSQISTASLGQYLRRNAADFPAARRSYLKADASRAQVYRARLLKTGQSRLIGVSWISKNPDIGMHKSSSLEALSPIWQAAGGGTTFVDLQYGDTAAERAATPLDLAHMDDLDLFNDIDGLAALISACDLVITVSNTTAHLAGALGVPLWVMIPGGNGKLWYWGSGHGATPCYPQATAFKQTTAGAWDEVIGRITQRMTETP